jgi:hypothetical protein
MKRSLRIADLVLAIESDDLAWAFEPDAPQRLFDVDQQAGDVQVDVHWHPLGQQDFGDEIFSLSNDPATDPPDCRLFCNEEGLWTFEVHSGGYLDGTKLFLERVAVFQPGFRRGDLYIKLARRDLDVYPNPLRPPLDRVLFVNLMAQHEGMLLHSCGVVVDGRGYVFVGASGAGKSTMAGLWAEYDDVTVLGEECLILRRKGTDFWVYGTPWIGESWRCSPLGAPIAGIYFIRHARRNVVTPLPAERAMEQLLSRSYLTSYEPSSANKGLDLGLDLSTRVPVYDFGFLPDKSAVRLIREGRGRD